MLHSSFLGKAYRDFSSPPDYTLLWVFLGILGISAIVAVSILLYRLWQKSHCIPVTLAGKTLYVNPGETFKHANALTERMGEDWLSRRIKSLESQGFRVEVLFTNSELTAPFDIEKPITTPTHLFPKITK